MSLPIGLITRLAAAFFRLPTPIAREVAVERDIRIPMPDGVTLEADRLSPVGLPLDECPVVIMTTCYERKTERMIAHLIAPHGYQVVVVSARGTFGSDGTWRPFFNEQADARAVVAWTADQPWYSGSIGAAGGSYLSISHWALGVDPPEHVKAFGTAVMTSTVPEAIYRGGSFDLQSMLTWVAQGVDSRLPTESLGDRVNKVVRARTRPRRLAAGFAAIPLTDADLVTTGTRVAPFQDWLGYESAANPVWTDVSFRRDLDRMPPMSMLAGWYDPYIAGQLADFVALREAGRDVRITVGPWKHDQGLLGPLLRDQIEWLGIHLKGAPRPHRAPVRVFVMGEKRWRDLPSWPPPADLLPWHLHSDGRLSEETAPDSPADRYRYDPADPTPVLGGGSLQVKTAGARDNRPVEARADMLTYTTDELRSDVTVIGPVAAVLHVRSTLDHTDFFARLCDVHPDGRSINLCDGLVRMTPDQIDRASDGSFRVRIEMAGTANTFRKGHRIRLQVSSGAHPLYARNPGTDEPLGKATTLVVADQEVLHDPDHPSLLELPVTTGKSRQGQRRTRGA